ncbi:GerAB/ArcD/ProY family transporter [Brevibacillus sp. HB2.2]|uniref:GerAB/ArcD/ProY family transporter n=1 Tax=Brevibacillus sp. HB2.2 TaxID=2738846 RepID=UPI00156B4261|nr:GerAB/ArcD/ProY family transporter [Brevibacillus sp. HB2.2]NRS52058.1 GerAB/ArcD/ProY family transporter [Brevibacillus sp. HB2.2]
MKEKLSRFHITILIYMTQQGVGIFSLPGVLATYFGTNGWVALFIILAITSINIFLIHLVYRKGNGESVFTILESAIPKFLLVPLYIGFIAVWSIFSCLILQEYVLILQMMSFPTVPTYIFKFIIDAFVVLILVKGIYVIGKTSTAFFFLSVWLVLLEVFVVKEFKFSRFTPFLFKGDTNFLEGGYHAYFSFLGYELSLFLFPYINQKSKFTKSVLTGNLLSTIVYLSVSIIAFGFFGYEQLRNMLYPLLDLLAYIRLPFVERIENLLFGFFLFLATSTSVMYYWASVETVKRMLPKIKTNVIGFVLVAATFFYSIQFDAISDLKKVSSFLSKIEIGIAFSLPIMLLLILLIRGRKHDNA